MKNVLKLFTYKYVKLVLCGGRKALIIAQIASFCFAAFLVYQLYGPTFDKKLHFFGTAADFLVFALVITIFSSIPVAIVTFTLLAAFLRLDGMNKRLSYPRSFITGSAIGFVVGGLGGILIGNKVGDMFLYITVAITAGIASGLGGLWMTKDAVRLYRS